MNINHKNIYHLQLKTYTEINPKHIDYLFTTLWYEMFFHGWTEGANGVLFMYFKRNFIPSVGGLKKATAYQIRKQRQKTTEKLSKKLEVAYPGLSAKWRMNDWFILIDRWWFSWELASNFIFPWTWNSLQVKKNIPIS